MDKVFDLCLYCKTVTEQTYVDQCCETLIKCKNCGNIVDFIFKDMEEQYESVQ